MIRTIKIVCMVLTVQLALAQGIIKPVLSGKYKPLIPATDFQRLQIFPTEKKQLSPMSLSIFHGASDSDGHDHLEGQPINPVSEQERSFFVQAAGYISANVTVELTRLNMTTAAVEQRVSVKLIDPANKVVDSINNVSIRYQTPIIIKLKGFAGTNTSGCGKTTNKWTVKVLAGNIFSGLAVCNAEVVIPSVNSAMNTFPTGGFGLAPNAVGDIFFATPKNSAGKLTIKITYNGTSQLEARLFKPGVEPLQNESNAAIIKLGQNTYLFTFPVVATDQTDTETLWTIRLRNKGTGSQQVTNAQASVNFSSCP